MAGETLRYAAVMTLAGIGIPVLAALNARLGSRIGSPAAAATILFAVALCGAAATMIATRGTPALAAAPGQPRHLFLAGLLVAFYVLSVTWVAPLFGLGNAIMFVLLGQLVSAAVIDQFGLMGAIVRQVTPMRGAGIALMAAGVFLAQRG
ncbi:DMT family transporter [Albidovulum sp.]|uniref:DMT family transporter n=1 Tax=Albidovulum sp. TaxID=1872424 RepID=UPI0039B9CD05